MSGAVVSPASVVSGCLAPSCALIEIPAGITVETLVACPSPQDEAVSLVSTALGFPAPDDGEHVIARWYSSYGAYTKQTPSIIGTWDAGDQGIQRGPIADVGTGEIWVVLTDKAVRCSIRDKPIYRGAEGKNWQAHNPFLVFHLVHILDEIDAVGGGRSLPASYSTARSAMEFPSMYRVDNSWTAIDPKHRSDPSDFAVTLMAAVINAKRTSHDVAVRASAEVAARTDFAKGFRSRRGADVSFAR